MPTFNVLGKEVPCWSCGQLPCMCNKQGELVNDFTPFKKPEVAAHDKLVADPETGALKADGVKNRLDLWPVYPFEQVGWVLSYGAQKYADRNWEKGMKWSRLYGAALRHLFAWWRGEDKDPESGLSHLSHAACCIVFLLELEQTKPEFDDRPK